jgi:hypothetical protein
MDGLSSHHASINVLGRAERFDEFRRWLEAATARSLLIRMHQLASRIMFPKGVEIIGFHNDCFHIIGRVQVSMRREIGAFELIFDRLGIFIPGPRRFIGIGTNFTGYALVIISLVDIFVAHLMDQADEGRDGFAKGDPDDCSAAGLQLVACVDNLAELIGTDLPTGELLIAITFWVVTEFGQDASMTTGKFRFLLDMWKEGFFDCRATYSNTKSERSV